MKKEGQEKKHRIAGVLPGSIAEEMGIEKGDALLSVNGKEVADLFDYQYALADSYVEVLIEGKDKETCLLEIEKEEDEDLGLLFENALMDEYHACRNRCIFCFIDQMPPGMRETLYFKDDDTRLSFLQGNYVTLTNLTKQDVERICFYRMEPVNISVHTTDPALRVKMLRNKHAGEALSYLADFAAHEIAMNGQIVLCKGYNDGAQLEKTIGDLAKYYPSMQSVSIVPVGLTKFRENLTALTPFTREDAENLLGVVERWQKKFREAFGRGLVYASDEWYLLAEREIPAEEAYDGYPQLENGVGMLRNFLTEAEEALNDAKEKKAPWKPFSGLSVTGLLAAPYIRAVAEKTGEAEGAIDVLVLPVENRFFGERITVTGLLTGKDLIRAVKECLSAHPQYRGKGLLIPCEMLRAGETVFLDDVTVEEVAAETGLSPQVVMNSGAAFVNTLLGLEENRTNRRQHYEQADRSDRWQAECGKIDPV